MGALLSGIYNYSPERLMKWRNALGAVKTGLRNATALFVGNSTTLGYGSQGLNVNSNLKALSYPTQLAGMLTSAGAPAVANGFLGEGNPPGLVTQAEPRLSVGAGWTQHNLLSIGRYGWFASSAGGALSFTPGTNIDTFVVYYLEGTGTGMLSIDVNGGTATTFDTSGAVLAVKSTLIHLGTAGTGNTINLRWSSGQAVYVQGFDAYNSSSKVVRFINAGWCAAGAADFADVSSPWTEANAIAAIAPDLTVLDLPINDWRLGTPIPTFKACAQTIITKAVASGDCLLLAAPQSDPAVHSAALQATYIDALRELADTNGLVLVDLYSRLPFSAAVAAGLMTGDPYHPTAAGYHDFGPPILNVLMA